MKKVAKRHEKFGTLLGVASDNVSVYSSDYDTIEVGKYDTRESLRSYVDEIYMGYKWQCVEFARRWCYLKKGFVFDDVSMAYEIYDLTDALDVRSNARIPLKSFRNGCKRRPEVGSLLIWKDLGFFELTGHVAVIVNITDNYIDIAEQNVEQHVWEAEQNYSRRLKVKLDKFGGFWVACDQVGTDIIGWVTQTSDDNYADEVKIRDSKLYAIREGRAEIGEIDQRRGWLNVANLEEELYVKSNGYSLASNESDENLFYYISNSAHEELIKATNELHAIFMHTTHLVLANDKWFQKFNIPKSLWEKIQNSWKIRKNESITGRFDFCFTDSGLKLYEYNIDTSSCYLETAKIQGNWAQHYGCGLGFDPGEKLSIKLDNKWREINLKGLLHIFTDPNDSEEAYHCYYMKKIIESAGIKTKVIDDLNKICIDSNGNIIDDEGNQVRSVWKTWSWETAMQQIRQGQSSSTSDVVRLSEVLLNDRTLIFEPLWSVVTSNKAMLAIMSELYPGNPYLLKTGFNLTDDLKERGYVVKPIAGRCGDNIELFDAKSNERQYTEGKFSYQDNIYQELCVLPKLNDYYVQVSSFTVNGSYAAACTRVEKDMIVTKDSDVLPLRIVEDDLFKNKS